MAADSKRIPTLDGWRAIAIASVIVHHVAAQKAILTNQPEPVAWTHFAMGVDIFFAISGLLITTLLIGQWQSVGTIGLRAFYIRRAFRILPPALSYLAVVGWLGLFSSPADAISCLTFWRNYLPFHLNDIYTAHFWSLSLEEQFYLIWPVTLAIAGLKRAPKVLFWAIIGLNVWRMFALQSPGPIIAVRTDIRGDGLLWGCLAAFAYARFPRFQIPRFVFVASVILAPILFSLFAALCVFPVLVAAAVLATVQHPGWTVSSLLEWRPLVWIGERSYGIYIWQQILIAYGHLEMPFWASMALRIVATLVLAEISYVLLENPLRRIGQRMAANLRSQPLRGSVAGATEPGV